jgi:hypothetical protein
MLKWVEKIFTNSCEQGSLDISNDNGVREVNFATSENPFAKNAMVSCQNFS